MSDVKRWTIGAGYPIPGTIQQYTQGVEVVLASDYDALKSEAQALREEVAALRARVVVFPERHPGEQNEDLTKILAQGWNLCLDELERLNGKVVSMADISACLDAELREWTGDHRKAVERALTDANWRIRALLGEGKDVSNG